MSGNKLRLRALLATAMILNCLPIPGWCGQALVFQSDFGREDGAVASMKGVAYSVSPQLRMFDISHEIPVFNVWEAAYRLQQTAKYWPPGTVFVSVVDPGVGTERKSVVLQTKSGHFFVSPDNGSLTLVAESLGIEGVREIDEHSNRLPDSERSYTFHGRDVYAYTGARLASGLIRFSDVGPRLENSVQKINYARAKRLGNVIVGNIPILDVHFGNVWTNIDHETFRQLGVAVLEPAWVEISHGQVVVFKRKIPFVNTFGQVAKGETVLYINDLLNVAVAVNQGSFAHQYGVEAGPDWNIRIWTGN